MRPASPRRARLRDRRAGRNRGQGFTLIELLVVMAVLGLLLMLAAPRYVQHVDNAREAVLRQNLLATRSAIDHFYADRARYPATLDELVRERYLRALPQDPVTDRSDTWQLLPPPGAAAGSAVFDLRSGAIGRTPQGQPYASL